MDRRVEKVVVARRKWRYLALLISLLILFLISPFIVEHRFGVVALNVVGAAVLFSGAFAVSERRSLRVLAFCLAVITVSANATIILHPERWLVMVSYVSVISLMTLFSVYILINVVQSGRVTSDKICGAICVYLLVGYAWSFAYAILEVRKPGSFLGLAEPGEVVENVSLVMQLRYFSFATLTTVGYGDITPRSLEARTFATLEAVMGQVYLAVLVARLVGLHIVHAQESQAEKDDQR
jgi:hypothetical protein